MKSFLLFLNEATLKGGKRTEYDTQKYITPYIGKKDTHTLNVAHGEIPADAAVSIHGHHIDEKGIPHALVSYNNKKYKVPYSKINKPETGRSGKKTYNDEHATANVWNHLVSIRKPMTSEDISREIERAKSDKSHPLHFDNADSSGFSGKKKTEDHRDSYYQELERAGGVFGAMSQHPHFKEAIKNGWRASVAGAGKGNVSNTWLKHNAKEGTSKADIVISDPRNPSKKLTVSMKKGEGSQLMSAGPEETKAIHDHAAREMLNTHPAYKKRSKQEKDFIHAHIMKQLDIVSHHLNSMKDASREQQVEHKNHAQEILDNLHAIHPHLNNFIRREATTGRGKFGANSDQAANYLVKSGKNPKVEHVDDVEYGNCKPRVALPKEHGRTGNVKADEKCK